jgi:hypothetical protein
LFARFARYDVRRVAAVVVASSTGSRAAVLRRREPTRFSSASCSLVQDSGAPAWLRAAARDSVFDGSLRSLRSRLAVA